MKIRIITLVLAVGVFMLLVGSLGTGTPLLPSGDSPSPEKPEANETTTAVDKPSSVVNHTSSATYSSRRMNSPRVAASSQQYQREKIENNTVVSKGESYPLRIYQTQAMPNDPLASQWWVPAANLESMWEIPRGDNETLLAIIDTGFALEHEEFQNRWYANPEENGPTTEEAPSKLNCSDRGLALDQSCNLIDDNYDGIVDNESGATLYENPSRLNCTDQGVPLDKSCNMIDDSGNGLVDDHRGWDFINHDNSAQAGEVNQNGEGTRHGTLVLGVAAATGNNNRGIAGVDWGTKILPLQALDDDSYGHTVSIARSIRYAAAQGADVISISLGSTLSDPYVREAVAEAIAAGSIVVAASGNDGCNCMVFPANYPEVVAVGALNTNNAPANFSSWGSNLDILAPGVNITTTDWRQSNQTTGYASGIAGTSLATPMVSGLLTRMLSHQPETSPLQMIGALSENTNRLGLNDLTSRSDLLGFGTIDAYEAVRRMTVPNNPPQLYQYITVSNGASFNLSSPAEVDKPLQVHNCSPDIIGTTPVHKLTKGSLKFFTASDTEKHQALTSGYASSLLAYGCVQLPHDQPDIIRQLNILREF